MDDLTAQPANGARSWIDRIPYGVFVPIAALAACLLVVYFFCPRYYLWSGLDSGVSELQSFPEVNRALSVLDQLQDPFVKKDDPSNRVILWRLFFPIVGHYLHLGRYVFLALPFLGAWAAAALLVHVACREALGRRNAFLAATLACGSAWFFVSTAWLSYNDGWIILGLTAVAAVPSRVVLALCCLLMPWIDERYLLALPTALALRAYFFPGRARPMRALLVDVGVAGIASAPFAIIRLAAYLRGTDPVTQAYAAENFGRSIPLWTYVAGTWAGLRCNWFYALAWAALSWRFVQRRFAVLSVVGVLASLVGMHLLIPGDLHRTAAVFAPVALAGVVLLQRTSARASARLLPVLTVLNLALPAAHVITEFQIPIFGFFDERNHVEQNLVHPYYQPQYYNDLGTQMVESNQIQQAIVYFDCALRISPAFRHARLNKCFVLVRSGRIDDAIAELNAALEIDPDWPDASFHRGQCREKKGDLHGAADDYDRALRVAPPDWSLRKDTEGKAKRLRDLGISPSP